MIIRKLFKLLQRVYRHYTREDVDSNQWKQLLNHVGEKSMIHYPAIISVDGCFSIGDDTTILSNSRIQNYGANAANTPPHGQFGVFIGDRCYIGYYFSVLNASIVIIGDDVLIASHVLISSENHGIDPEVDVPYMSQPLVSKPVIIGDGCWIGEKVCILPGVSIGKKCVIGAGSVVTKSIPAYSIAVGNTAKVIKKFNFETHNWEKV